MSDLTNETQTPKINLKRPRGTGCLYQQKGSSNWWIQYYQNGKSYRESTGTDKRRRAAKIRSSTPPMSAVMLFRRIPRSDLGMSSLTIFATTSGAMPAPLSGSFRMECLGSIFISQAD